jgi:hypothetical protein
MSVLLSLWLALCFSFVYLVRIDTEYHYLESPVVRWKFALYYGECDAETGCHFNKIPHTGILEYLGLKNSWKQDSIKIH